MTYKGYKMRVRCTDWEQIDVLNRFWNLLSSYVESEKIIGLGMNWSKDYSYFDYALGVIDDEDTLSKIKKFDLSKKDSAIEYVEIVLPDFREWETFKGKEKDLKKIYEEYIDCYEKPYDYELEYIDSKGNIEIKIHFINRD